MKTIKNADPLEVRSKMLKCLGVKDIKDPVPQDVRNLVIAARIVAFEDQSPEALRALDKASEPFAEKVPWDE